MSRYWPFPILDWLVIGSGLWSWLMLVVVPLWALVTLVYVTAKVAQRLARLIR